MPSRMNVTSSSVALDTSRANSVPMIWTSRNATIHGNAGVITTIRRLMNSS